MKKIKRIFLILVIFLCFNGCETNPVEEGLLQRKEELTVDQAKAFVDAQRLNQFTLKGGELQKQTIGIRAEWSKSKSDKNEKISLVETEIQAMGGFGFATAESIDAWKASSNQAYLYSMSRLVVVKQKETGEMYSFIMSIVGDKQYFEGKNFKLKDNTYLKRDKDLTGLVLFHNLNGEFVNGWIYCDGQITNSIIRSENLDLQISLKSATMMVAIYTWVVECKYWITIGSVDGQLVSYSYRETCSDIQVITGYYETGDSGIGSGTQGGYTPPIIQPCNCTHICPVCGKCLDNINLKSASLSGDSIKITLTAACELCNCPPRVNDPNLPCTGDPIKSPSICATNSGRVIGGTFGCVRIVLDNPNCDERPYNKRHEGIDISAPYCSNLYAMTGGVLTVHNDPGGLGLYANIRNEDSGTDYIYGHLQEVNINNGQTVHAGDIIGKTGSSGNADGTPPHVHISVKLNGTRVDPIPYFATKFDCNGTIITTCNIINQ